MKQPASTLTYLEKIVADVLHTDGSAKRVALSFAIGTFIALLPTFGIGVFVGLLFLLLFPYLHKPALLSAFVVWNPFVQIPLYSLGIAIGAYLYSGMPVVTYDFVLLDQVIALTRRVLIGNLIVTSTLTLLSYAAIFILIRKMKHRPLIMNTPPKTKSRRRRG